MVRCTARGARAMVSACGAREKTPPPHPGPLRPQGQRGRVGGAACVPPPPLGEGDRGRWGNDSARGGRRAGLFSLDSKDHGAVHRARRPRHGRAMRHTGGQGATVAARGRFSVEWLPPASAAARPAESHLSHLIPLNPGKSRINILYFARLAPVARTATGSPARPITGSSRARRRRSPRPSEPGPPLWARACVGRAMT